MDACDLNVSQTHGKNTAAWNAFADPGSCAVRSLRLEPGFVFFFMQADLFSKMYKKCLSSKQSTLNGTLFLFSLFQLMLSPESSLDCTFSTFVLAVSFLFSFTVSLLWVFLFMSCNLHVLAVSTCPDHSKWRRHDIKGTEAVLVALSVVSNSL